MLLGMQHTKYIASPMCCLSDVIKIPLGEDSVRKAFCIAGKHCRIMLVKAPLVLFFS